MEEFEDTLGVFAAPRFIGSHRWGLKRIEKDEGDGHGSKKRKSCQILIDRGPKRDVSSADGRRYKHC